MSFLASVGVTNVDLMYVGMPRVPQEGEEIFSQDFRVLLGGGAILENETAVLIQLD